MLNTYEDFKKEFYKLAQIDLNAYKENQMRRRINSFIEKKRCYGYVDFFQLIQKDRGIFDDFITYLTINVSEFYRNPSQWNVLEKVVIPHLVACFGRKLRVWSAACSTGDEPYSLAMLLGDYVSLGQLEIIATDMDKEVLSIAKKGCYTAKSLKGLPDKYLEKYFTKQPDGMYRIDDSIRRCIQFRQHNLLKDPYPTDVDLLVCRNVLIYFTDEAKNDVYRNFVKSMKKRGILFIGSTEQIIGSERFGLETFQSFFYKKV